MTASVFVKAFLFCAARIAIASGGSPFALALDISDKTTPSFRDIDASSNAAFRLFSIPLMIFLLIMIQNGIYSNDPTENVYVPVFSIGDYKVVGQINQFAVPSQVLDTCRVECT